MNCLLCQNVCRLGSQLPTYDETGYLVDHAEGDSEKFHLHTDQSVWSCFDRLLGTPPDGLEAMQVVYGMHGDPVSLFGDTELRPYVGLVLHTMFDFGHVFVINGLCQFEMTEFLARAKPLGITFAKINTWLAAWTWPTSEHNPPTHVFGEARGGEFKAGSSECLSMYGVFREFVLTMIKPTDLVHETSSLMSMFKILDGWPTILDHRNDGKQRLHGIMPSS